MSSSNKNINQDKQEVTLDEQKMRAACLFFPALYINICNNCVSHSKMMWLIFWLCCLSTEAKQSCCDWRCAIQDII